MIETVSELVVVECPSVIEASRVMQIVPLTLLDLDELAKFVVSYYESFDLDGRALIPLVRVYWVAE